MKNSSLPIAVSLGLALLTTVALAQAPHIDWHAPLISQSAADAPQVLSADVVEVSIPAPTNPVVEIAICLDTSGSMDGLIESAKQKLWAIVNEFVFADPQPRLRVALYTYGNDGHSPEMGWVKLETPLTEDLDLVSMQLFAQSTNGGTELVGRVVRAATTELEWSPDPSALRLIVVAGNETADQDRAVPFAEACRAAIGRDIMVNAIYCGPPTHVDCESWRQVARLADGQFATIDHNNGTVALATPFDVQLSTLSADLNGTYLAYGTRGEWFGANQVVQDLNAAGQNADSAASRAFCKANGLYNNPHWDLVDALKEKKVVLADVPVEELPEGMRAMTLAQRESHVALMGEQRAKVQARINDLAGQRQLFIEKELKAQQLDDSNSFDGAFRKALRGQARARGYRFPAAEPALEPVVGTMNAGQPEAQGQASPKTEEATPPQSGTKITGEE